MPRQTMPAKALPGLALLALLLPGCGALPERGNPISLWRDATGASLDARLPPPGLDQPTPNLASVPPVPNRPDLATRNAILRGLEGTREAAATPLPEGREDAPRAASASPGNPPIPAGPPPPPRLVRAPGVPWGPARGAAPEPALPPLPQPEPGALPPPPTPELLAPPPPPNLRGG